jgi:hypothetical protein
MGVWLVPGAPGVQVGPAAGNLESFVVDFQELENFISGKIEYSHEFCELFELVQGLLGLPALARPEGGPWRRNLVDGLHQLPVEPGRHVRLDIVNPHGRRKERFHYHVTEQLFLAPVFPLRAGVQIFCFGISDA